MDFEPLEPLLTYSSRGVESLESAAYEIAKQALDTQTRRDALVPCTPSGVADKVCAAKALKAIAARAWRRPVEDKELAALVDVSAQAGVVLDDFYDGLEYGIAGILQSPYFLFRVEIGSQKATSKKRTLTDFELAARLSFFLWNTPPDTELEAAAADGSLSTDEGLFEQANRLLNDPRARDGIRALFHDYLKLYELEHLTKDPTVFEHFNDQLGHFAREETLRLIEDIVFDHPRDFRELLTTRVTFLNPMLASIYKVPNPKGEDFTRVELPQSANRVGMLGHVSFLGVHSHSRASSATRRGVAVRTILLCQSIPAPPVDVDTSIPEPSGDIQTLRERVAEHLANPACAGCHQLTDPIGLGLENYDGIGRYRSTEYGDVIDPAGKLDGREFKDAVELAHAIRNHKEFVPCVVKVLSRYAVGRLESDGEADWLDVLSERFKIHGYQLRPLILELVMSPLFRGIGELKEELE